MNCGPLPNAEHGHRRRVPVALVALRGDERQTEHALVELDRPLHVRDGKRDVVHRGHRNRGGGRLRGRGGSAACGGGRGGPRGDDQRRQGEHQLATCHAPALEPLDELLYGCAHALLLGRPGTDMPATDMPATELRSSVDRSTAARLGNIDVEIERAGGSRVHPGVALQDVADPPLEALDLGAVGCGEKMAKQLAEINARLDAAENDRKATAAARPARREADGGGPAPDAAFYSAAPSRRRSSTVLWFGAAFRPRPRPRRATASGVCPPRFTASMRAPWATR